MLDLVCCACFSTDATPRYAIHHTLAYCLRATPAERNTHCVRYGVLVIRWPLLYVWKSMDTGDVGPRGTEVTVPPYVTLHEKAATSWLMPVKVRCMGRYGWLVLV